MGSVFSFRLLFCFSLFGLMITPVSHATTVMADAEYALTLSDDTTIWVRTAGSADAQWLETASGQLIVKRSGYWYEAVLDETGERALSTGVPMAAGPVLAAEKVSPLWEDASFSFSKSAISQSVDLMPNQISAKSFALSASSEPYEQPVLVVRVSFSNQDFHYPLSSFQKLMFSEDSTQDAAGSVALYYRENSYQKFHIKPAQEQQGQAFDGVVDVRLSYAHPNFGANYGEASRNLAGDVMRAAAGYVNFKQFDANGDGQLSPRELGVVIMVAGYENAYGGAGASTPNVWAHKTEFSGLSVDGVRLSSYAMFGERHQGHLATIGIISHEMGHLLFSLPDLYDRQGDSNGIGRWGLMGLGSWNSHNGYSGSSPAHMLAWSKEKAGFLRPQDVAGDQLDFSLSPTSLGEEAMRVWLDPFKHGEHFLLEYRTQAGFDRGLPGEGLLISHVDDWVGYGAAGAQNDVAEHKLVDIEEADGRSDLDLMENRGDRLDVFNDAYGQNHFDSSSLPASLNYQGNSSGVEVSQIQVAKVTKGRIVLPYAQLGDNLGYDDGGIGTSWGAADSESLVEYTIPAGMSFVHGVDVFSYSHAVVSVTIFTSFQQGNASHALFTTESRTLTPGWNRLGFSQRVDVSMFNTIYLQLSADDSARAFTIDTAGDVSRRSYVKSNGEFQLANFDFNQRLLIANQEEEFSYQVPDKLPLNVSSNSKKSAGGIGMVFICCFALMAFVRRSWGSPLAAL